VFDWNFFPFRKENIVARLDEFDKEILCKASNLIKWLEYNPSMELGRF
jgi:hypothetical protein